MMNYLHLKAVCFITMISILIATFSVGNNTPAFASVNDTSEASLKNETITSAVYGVPKSALDIITVMDAATALTAINGATVSTLPGVITNLLAAGEDLGINKTIYSNLSTITKMALATEVVSVRPASGGFSTITAFKTAYETALKKLVVVIIQPMTGDIILSTENNENHFNGAGNDQGAMGLLTKFNMTGDINVESKYLLSVTYNLAVRTSSGNCSADDYMQNWSFYLTDGNWQEYRATYSSLDNRVTDRSKLLLTTNYKAQDKNAFDITDAYKSFLSSISTGNSFGIRTDIAQYQAVFSSENMYENNYLTYVIDKNAIINAMDKASATTIENVILKNGYAAGFDVGSYKNLTSRTNLNKTLASYTSILKPDDLKYEMDLLRGGKITLPQSGEVFMYEENSTGQNLSAKLTGRGTGAIWTDNRTSTKVTYVFDISNTPLNYLTSVRFNVKRSGGGKADSTIAVMSLFGADSSSGNSNPQSQMFYLDFNQTGKLMTVNKGVGSSVDVTDFVKSQTGKVFIGIAGIDYDALDGQANLEFQYEYAAVLAAFPSSGITQTKSILVTYGAMLGMTTEQMTTANISKAALALAGKTVTSLSQFRQMVAAGIANVGAVDALNAINAAQDISEFEILISEFGSVVNINTNLLKKLPYESRQNVLVQLYNNGIDYASGSDLKQYYDEIIIAAYESILSGFKGDNVNETKEFLLQNGSTLGISASDLSNNLEFLAIAFTSGNPITNIFVFNEIYSDYQNIAARNVLYILNSSQSVEEFDTIIKNYKDYLGLDLKLYNLIPNKSGIYTSLKGVYSEKDDFKIAFNAEIEKYMSAPVIAYAKNEIFIKAENQFSNNEYSATATEWTGTRSFGTHLIKYDLSQMNIDADKLAQVIIKLPIANNDDMSGRENYTFQVYSTGTGWPLSTTKNSYNNLAGANVFIDQKLAGERLIPLLKKGQYIEIDITDYIRNQIKAGKTGEHSFQFAMKQEPQSVILERKVGSESYAPMEFTFIEAELADVSYNIANLAKNVPCNTQVLISFGKALDPTSVSTGTIVVKKNGSAITDYNIQLGAGNATVLLKFTNPLDYNTLYNIVLTKNIRFNGDSKSYVFNNLSFTTEKIPLQFSGLTVSNEGKVINTLSERTSQNITASANVTNNSIQEPQRVLVIIGLYSTSDGVSNLIDSKTAVKTLNVGENAEIQANFTIPQQQGTTYSVECYVWDGFRDMKKRFSSKLQ